MSSSQSWERTLFFTLEKNDTSNQNRERFFFTYEKNDTSNQKSQRCVSFAPKFLPFIGACSALALRVLRRHSTRKVNPYLFSLKKVIFFFSLDCSHLFKLGHTQSGVYSVNPDGKGSFNVYCDMRTDGGGWTVFQRRQDGLVDFYRGWNDYKSGFGQLTAEFWLGNDKIHRLTAARPCSLRVELEDWNGVRVYAKYGMFNIGDEQRSINLEWVHIQGRREIR